MVSPCARIISDVSVAVFPILWSGSLLWSGSVNPFVIFRTIVYFICLKTDTHSCLVRLSAL